MRGATTIAGLGAALAVCLCATVAPTLASAAAPAVMPLWIDPQLLGSPAPAKVAPVQTTSARGAQAAAATRFTVTRVAADGTRVTEAIDATALQALGRASTAPARASAPAPIRAQAEASPPAPPPAKKIEPAPATVVAVARVEAVAVPSETAVLQAAAKRLTAEPWTALARRSLRSESAALAPLSTTADGKKRTEGKTLPFGVRDGRRYGETGRFYMYAAMKNKGVGMNVVDHGEAWGGDGVSYDQGGFAGQRSAGIGWRQGDISTSLGWVHAKTRINGLYGAPAEKDDRVAMTFSWRPQVPKLAPPVAVSRTLADEPAAK